VVFNIKIKSCFNKSLLKILFKEDDDIVENVWELCTGTTRWV